MTAPTRKINTNAGHQPPSATSATDSDLHVVIQNDGQHALRSTTRAFVRTSETYVRQWTDTTRGGRPTDQDLRNSRDALAAELRDVVAVRPKWTVLPRLLRLLSDGSLGDQLARTWPDLNDEARSAAAHMVRAELSELDITINQVARALEQPGRLHRAMRQPEPTSTGRRTPA